ncbi:MAG: LD-carboxypeptidase [Spirochaetales bacterium]|nr:LD-carboxypeptidase [Spirochaetales bacterium]
MLEKPRHLEPGDTVATVSLSWGGAGDAELLWRYEVGKKRLEDVFGLKVVEMEHTLKGSAYLKEHPHLRAQDLHQAFSDAEVKAVFSCIGGDDSIRMLPYIDYELLSHSPKVFLGYSDSTVTHLMLTKAGISSFYGPSVLAEFAENLAIYPYTEAWVRKTLFSNKPVGPVAMPSHWTGERLPWTEQNRTKAKSMIVHEGVEVLQGEGVMEGSLMGGCLEVLEMCIGTEIWPDCTDCLLFLETSEESIPPKRFQYMLNRLFSAGFFDAPRGLLFAKPYQGIYQQEYHAILKKTLSDHGLSDLPVAANLAFGHNEPMFILPYGAQGFFDCRTGMLSLPEPVVS